MRLTEKMMQDARGIRILKDWLGDEMHHVSLTRAELRAKTCLQGNNGKKCPHNKAPNWWERNVKNPIAQAIKSQLEIKSRFAMNTQFDSNLHMCSECGCNLPLKIWVPIEHVKKHTPGHVFDKFPEYCWQRIEMNL